MRAGRTAGYSVVELLISSTVLSVLVLASMPSFMGAVANANDMATRAYIHHVVKGVEIGRDSYTHRLPGPQSCAALIFVRDNPASVRRCRYEPDNDDYRVTAESVTGKTFLYDGSEVVSVE